jgi:hypothetical protein
MAEETENRSYHLMNRFHKYLNSKSDVMCVLNSTRKRTNRLQYSVCKCEVESTGKWSNIGVLFNQPHFNLVPMV